MSKVYVGQIKGVATGSGGGVTGPQGPQGSPGVTGPQGPPGTGIATGVAINIYSKLFMFMGG